MAGGSPTWRVLIAFRLKERFECGFNAAEAVLAVKDVLIAFRLKERFEWYAIDLSIWIQ